MRIQESWHAHGKEADPSILFCRRYRDFGGHRTVAGSYRDSAETLGPRDMRGSLGSCRLPCSGITGQPKNGLLDIVAGRVVKRRFSRLTLKALMVWLWQANSHSSARVAEFRPAATWLASKRRYTCSKS